MKLSENQVKNIVRQALSKLDIDSSLRGYIYIQHIVWLEYCDYIENMRTNLSDLYMLCARKFNTPASCVERCIRHAISTIDLSNQYYISILNGTSNLKNKNIIRLILQFVIDNQDIIDYVSYKEILERLEKLESEVESLRGYTRLITPFN